MKLRQCNTDTNIPLARPPADTEVCSGGLCQVSRLQNSQEQMRNATNSKSFKHVLCVCLRFVGSVVWTVLRRERPMNVFM